MSDFVMPSPLERGDAIAVVAPASNPSVEYPHVYERGLDRLRTDFDLQPVEFPTVSRDDEYLYEHPEARARDVMAAFENPDIGGVISVIGGNDQIRILRHLDSDVLRENPTRFYGYSDNTNLALYLWNLGIVSFYGPSVMTELAMDGELFDLTVEYTERAFFEDSLGTLRAAELFTDEPGDWTDPDALAEAREMEPAPGWTWRGGSNPVDGRLWGGCLEILDQQFLAGRYLPNDSVLDGTILVLETSEEVPDPEWVAGALRALGERGLLERFDGLLVGRPPARSHVEDRPPEWRRSYRTQQQEAISSVFAEYNPDAPIVLDVDFGHTWPTIPLAIGDRVEIDPVSETIRFA